MTSDEFLVNKRRRRWYNSSATEFRSISGHYLFHIVPRIPHLRARQRFVLLSSSGYCSVISRFRFSISFFRPFFFCLPQKGINALAINPAGQWEECIELHDVTLCEIDTADRLRITVRVEGLSLRMNDSAARRSRLSLDNATRISKTVVSPFRKRKRMVSMGFPAGWTSCSVPWVHWQRFAQFWTLGCTSGTFVEIESLTVVLWDLGAALQWFF